MELIDLKTIYVFDDLISNTYQDIILKNLTNDRTSYDFINEISHIQNKETNNFGFAKVLRNNNFTADLFYMFEPMLYEAYNRIGIEFSHILLGRVFLTTSGTQNKTDSAHVDLNFGHNVLLYYVNDSDGDTILYNKIYDEQDGFLNYYEPKFKIFKQITPKKGRVLMFNGVRYHSSTRPSKNYRIIANFNMI